MSKYNRKDLTEIDVCMHCGKDLRTVNEIHTVEGHLYCSKACAINDYTNTIIASAKDTATSVYNDCAEVVTPLDIGLCREEVWTSYSDKSDITTFFVSTYDGDDVLSVEVVGFYFGEPNDEDTERYRGQLKAIL